MTHSKLELSYYIFILMFSYVFRDMLPVHVWELRPEITVLTSTVCMSLCISFHQIHG